MTKEQQDLAWACLPKEERQLCRNMNRTSGDGNVEFLLDELFGHHNLTSDTEPSELLFVERKKVVEKYNKVTKDYTESETKSIKVGDTVRVKGDTKIRKVYRVLPDGSVMFGDKGSTYLAKNLELVELDNMEEKELNLCELLKGCEGEEFYSPTFGDVLFRRIDRGNNRVFISYVGIGKSDSGYYIEPEGNISLYGDCILFPSRALYEKYPLDPYSAWMEWKSERTPKRWRAKQGETYWYLDRRFISKECTTDANSDFDRTNYENGNMFHSKEESQQAAEAVKECLMKFHEQKPAVKIINY